MTEVADRGLAGAPFRSAVEAVAGKLVHVEHRKNASFVSTPVLYPSGSTVVVRVQPVAHGFDVSDMSFALQEAISMGASHVFQRHARALAEEAGVEFDGSSFSVLSVPERQLPAALMEVASCSKDAVGLTVLRRADERSADELADELYERLEQIFRRPNVSRDALVLGRSHTPWTVSLLVRPEGLRKATIFQPVKMHRNSYAQASMMLGDIALSESPPNRVIVVPDKTELGTFLGVLSQVANVVDRNIGTEQLSKLATQGTNGSAYTH